MLEMPRFPAQSFCAVVNWYNLKLEPYYHKHLFNDLVKYKSEFSESRACVHRKQDCRRSNNECHRSSCAAREHTGLTGEALSTASGKQGNTTGGSCTECLFSLLIHRGDSANNTVNLTTHGVTPVAEPPVSYLDLASTSMALQAYQP
ncbi:hypothetical protein CEXT_447001 [Caerostris extrusa]|uniref:Uncharacterized protein n=1 Tax=Caerostris extrusa TaxID=172846 RepID=A0AAV4S9I7_CAEEX|nr:hypothetical protein CEXT_447001 [Caerostris extrusa]